MLRWSVRRTTPSPISSPIPSHQPLSTFTYVSHNGPTLHLPPSPPETLSHLSLDLHTGLHKLSLSAGTTSATLTLDTDIAVELRANDTVAVHYGALIYAPPSPLPTPPRPQKPSTRTKNSHPLTRRRSHATSNSQTRPLEHRHRPVHANAQHREPVSRCTTESDLGARAPPTSVSVRACEIAWGIYKGVPDVTPPKADRKCLGDVFEAPLEPLGAAKLHMVDLPSIDLSGA